MRTVRVDKNREVEVPTTWAEGERMLTASLNAHYDGRGGNLERASVAGRVALGLFGAGSMAPDQTTALIYLLQRICRQKGKLSASLQEKKAGGGSR
jgi:hypothetical protein